MIPTTLIFYFLNGLFYASYLFLVASGLTIILGILNVLNLAHGSFYSFGAYVAAFIATLFLNNGLPTPSLFMALFMAALLIGLMGSGVEFSLKPLYKRRQEYQLLFTFALSFIFEDLIKLIWGFNPWTCPNLFAYMGAVNILGQFYPSYDMFVIFIGFVSYLFIWFFFYHTRTGNLARAVAFDKEMSSALGVNVSSLYTKIFFIGAFFAGLGGALILPAINAIPGMGSDALGFAFVIIVIGGLGSVKGAFVGSLIVGMVRAVGIALFPEIELGLIFTVLVIVLILKPQGLFGKRFE